MEELLVRKWIYLENGYAGMSYLRKNSAIVINVIYSIRTQLVGPVAQSVYD